MFEMFGRHPRKNETWQRNDNPKKTLKNDNKHLQITKKKHDTSQRRVELSEKAAMICHSEAAGQQIYPTLWLQLTWRTGKS